ncbi:Zn-ribbon domain-containing OB-fold protein [Xanthobacter sp. DSM 24535]|uniref:Zn-ribbon domain-containing OB-fold protein n=1 Tax=Roseixanthobacter psychrophilus TaxID=3119917 RepID=UPI00372AAC36
MSEQIDRPGTCAIRSGLFKTDPPRLIGSACRDCGVHTFPAREFCPECGSEQVTPDVALAPTGRLYSFTTVRQAPPGRRTPYNLGYVDLDDDVRVMAQVEADPATLQIGMPLHLRIQTVGRQDDLDLIGYVFIPSDIDQEVPNE